MLRARAAVAVAFLIAVPLRARADDPSETADGIAACRTFDAKNDRERAAYEKTQPATPYRYPRDEEVLGAPWGKLFDAIGSASGALVAATLVPHAGAQLRGTAPAALVSWPWSLPIGPATSCSRRQGTFALRLHRPHRALLEPGFVAGQRGTGVFVRPGYRYLHHPSEWVVGVGGGLGSTFEIAGNREPFRIGIGPEALLHFGHCCESSYFTLAVRYDRFFTGNVLNLVTGTLGYTFF